ncbi:hypothetical protein VCHC78A1_00014A, partial [Vibrio cholerae HC-78A1]
MRVKAEDSSLKNI